MTPSTGDAGPPSRPDLRGTFVYLIGVPAVGKYTVARAIGRLAGARVIDNQLINLPVFTVVGYDGTRDYPVPEGIWHYIEPIREAVFAAVRDLPEPGASFVFTNLLEEGDPGALVLFRRIEALAAERGATFVPVWLTCDADTIRRRKDSPDRRARRKDIDLRSVDWYVEEFKVFRIDHPNALTLDTAVSSAEETAQRILEHVAAIRDRDELEQSVAIS
jgi:hypothetical protein